MSSVRLFFDCEAIALSTDSQQNAWKHPVNPSHSAWIGCHICSQGVGMDGCMQVPCRGRGQSPNPLAVNMAVWEIRKTLAQAHVYILVHCTHGFNRSGAPKL